MEENKEGDAREQAAYRRGLWMLRIGTLRVLTVYSLSVLTGVSSHHPGHVLHHSLL